jgi:hypothetical protein
VVAAAREDILVMVAFPAIHILINRLPDQAAAELAAGLHLLIILLAARVAALEF